MTNPFHTNVGVCIICGQMKTLDPNMCCWQCNNDYILNQIKCKRCGSSNMRLISKKGSVQYLECNVCQKVYKVTRIEVKK